MKFHGIRAALETAVKLKREIMRIDSDQHRAEVRARFPHGDVYPYLFGELLACSDYSAIAAKYELERLADLERLLEGVDVDMCRDANKQAYWCLTVPKCVQVPCPLCGALVACEVRRDDDIDETAEACYTAQIDAEKCEDCGKAMCPHCPKTSDDLHGVRCPACQENFDISRAEKQMERS